MQVTCPSCGARYAVDPLAIGPSGRTVQCVRCSHRWFATIKVAPAASAIPPAREGPVPDFVIRPQPHYSAGLPALTTPRRPVQWGRWIGALVMLVLVVGAAAFAYRNEIRDRLPPEWRAILSLQAVRGVLAWPVRGEVVNTGHAAASTSTLEPVFRKGDDVLGERAYPLSEGPIAPGARLSFSRPLDEPPDGTTNIVPTVE